MAHPRRSRPPAWAARERTSNAQRIQPEVPKSLRRPDLRWADWLIRAGNSRDRGLYLAYREAALTMLSLAERVLPALHALVAATGESAALHVRFDDGRLVLPRVD
jgi:hypothetical protein